MCFYSKLSKKAIELERRFNAKFENPELFSPAEMINGFSFPMHPVIANDEAQRICMFNWGLIPSWSKNNEIRKHTLNARSETLESKPAFRDAAHNRCLVLVDGFYEWQWQDAAGKKKKKFLMHMPDHEAFALAGIWSDWYSQDTGELFRTFSIVTTEAMGIMKEIHNSKLRMPVIPGQNAEADWLGNCGVHALSTAYSDLLAQPC